MLPANIRLIRSWAGHPLCMVQELDESFDAVMMIGYHAAAGSRGQCPCPHAVAQAASDPLNGTPASEFLIHALAGAHARRADRLRLGR